MKYGDFIYRRKFKSSWIKELISIFEKPPVPKAERLWARIKWYHIYNTNIKRLGVSPIPSDPMSIAGDYIYIWYFSYLDTTFNAYS